MDTSLKLITSREIRNACEAAIDAQFARDKIADVETRQRACYLAGVKYGMQLASARGTHNSAYWDPYPEEEPLPTSEAEYRSWNRRHARAQEASEFASWCQTVLAYFSRI
jgi:hypothetical protein